MVNVQAQFEKAVQIVRELPADGPIKPTQDQQLAFYSHYKQATEGDNTGPAPGAFNFTAKYKYNAWKKLEGLSKEAAQAKYVELLKEMIAKTPDEPGSKKALEELEAAGAQ